MTAQAVTTGCGADSVITFTTVETTCDQLRIREHRAVCKNKVVDRRQSARIALIKACESDAVAAATADVDCQRTGRAAQSQVCHTDTRAENQPVRHGDAMCIDFGAGVGQAICTVAQAVQVGVVATRTGEGIGAAAAADRGGTHVGHQLIGVAAAQAAQHARGRRARRCRIRQLPHKLARSCLAAISELIVDAARRPIDNDHAVLCIEYQLHRATGVRQKLG